MSEPDHEDANSSGRLSNEEDQYCDFGSFISCARMMNSSIFDNEHYELPDALRFAYSIGFMPRKSTFILLYFDWMFKKNKLMGSPVSDKHLILNSVFIYKNQTFPNKFRSQILQEFFGQDFSDVTYKGEVKEFLDKDIEWETFGFKTEEYIYEDRVQKLPKKGDLDFSCDGVMKLKEYEAMRERIDLKAMEDSVEENEMLNFVLERIERNERDSENATKIEEIRQVSVRTQEWANEKMKKEKEKLIEIKKKQEESEAAKKVQKTLDEAELEEKENALSTLFYILDLKKQTNMKIDEGEVKYLREKQKELEEWRKDVDESKKQKKKREEEEQKEQEREEEDGRWMRVGRINKKHLSDN